jgi:predicted phosphodiesterase
MRSAIISDIHGNLPALKAVLERLTQENCDQIICLGDIVGYGPYPNECIELVKRNCRQSLIGNHDHAVLGLTSTESFNIYAKMAIDWTMAELMPVARDYLKSLPFSIAESNVLYVHATPCEPEGWNYLLSTYDAQDNLKCFEQQVCFVGHSHVPVIFEQQETGNCKIIHTNSVALGENNRYVINVGSVGQPRDGKPSAAFGIYDSENNEYQFLRQEYDVSKTQKAMMDNDLPYFLVDRLSRGQ